MWKNDCKKEEIERELKTSDKMKMDGVQGGFTRRSAFFKCLHQWGKKKESAFLGPESNT